MMPKNDFVVIIPARIDSSRLPNKMILTINKIPIIVHTARQALKSMAGKVIVATDNQDIMNICKQYEINATMTKVEHNSGTERVAEVVEKLNFTDDQIIVNVQGDEAMLDSHLIDQLAEFIALKKTEAATLAHPICNEDEVFNPHVVKVVLNHLGNALYFSRAPIPYYRDGFINRNEFKLPNNLNILRHIGIYAFTAKFLKQYNQMAHCAIENIERLEQLRMLYNGHNIAVLETNTIPETGIDTLEDLQRARQIMSDNHNQLKEND
ncbi:MAG: 3-deoxy-manno-octulosonate cytidylyltransferase synthetase [Pseudomonadota bacterium]|nr:3-deoxy-manno-octulosonate cytidylyltransferase synthetase [Pseudomonadota bacterium]